MFHTWTETYYLLTSDYRKRSWTFNNVHLPDYYLDLKTWEMFYLLQGITFHLQIRYIFLEIQPSRSVLAFP